MVLLPPTGLTVTIISTTQVDLAWTNGDTYDEVEIERKAEGGSYTVYIQNKRGIAKNYMFKSFNYGY